MQIKKRQQMIRAVKIALVLVGFMWVLWRVTGLLWTAVEPSPGAVPQGRLINAPDSSSHSVDTQALLALELFSGGTVVTSEVVERSAHDELADLRETNLQITLSAVIASNHADLRAAVIAINGQQAVYKVGESLPIRGAVTIDDVFEKTVVLINNGARERLSLDDDEYEGISVTEVATPTRSVSVSTNDESLVAQFIQFKPVLNGLTLEGVKIEPGSDPRLFELLELSAGDAIVSFGGVGIQQLTNPADIQNMLQSQDEFTMVVQRGDVVRTVEFDKRLLERLLQ